MNLHDVYEAPKEKDDEVFSIDDLMRAYESIRRPLYPSPLTREMRTFYDSSLVRRMWRYFRSEQS